jgi:choline dehydrogenase
MEMLPRNADTLIIGGGTTGAALAGLLAERSEESILVLEAGPDFGPYGDGGWPRDVLDATWLAQSNQLGYAGDDGYRGRRVEFQRASMVGGCSSHNGCAAIWGSRLDYDAFAAAGLTGWSRDELEPLLRAASGRMRVRIPEEAELAPFHRAALASLVALGVPRVHDLNDLDADTGVAPSPVNIAGGVRWNAALAYLDPVRERASLRICGDAPAERLLVDGGRVRGAVVRRAGEPVVEAERVIVCAGAYDSPALLLRSGLGPANELRALGIHVVADLPGVGANLHDHPAVGIGFTGTRELRDLCAEYAATGAFAPIEGVIAKLRSTLCAPAGFDLHVYPVGGLVRGGGQEFWIPVACLTPRSRGRVRLASPSGRVAPVIDHAYCSDPEGHDHAVLRGGVELARSLARSGPFAELLGAETEATAGLGPQEAVDAVAAHYYHPAGTCAMGSVVDERLRVHGVDGLLVADCSVFPAVPRANTCMPAVLVAHRLAGWL